LIDPSQTGAGPDKVIFDNLFSISSILEYMDVNELDGLLISFDQEHFFITEVLKAMNLPVNFITWVSSCLTRVYQFIYYLGKAVC
jgi:hypothetical protein